MNSQVIHQIVIIMVSSSTSSRRRERQMALEKKVETANIVAWTTINKLQIVVHIFLHLKDKIISHHKEGSKTLRCQETIARAVTILQKSRFEISRTE